MKGLLLNYEYGMWDAVLAKIKTNTRRAHKTLNPVNEAPDNYDFVSLETEKDGTVYARFRHKEAGPFINCRARYHLNEVSFLQEPTMNLKGYCTDEEMTMYRYRDKDGHDETEAFAPLIARAQQKGAQWSNKMFMGQKDARYFIKITKIEVQRLRDISDADCLAEGIQKESAFYFFTIDGKRLLFDTPQKAYFSLYERINRNGPENPWVFSYHFQLCNANGE